MDKVRLGIIGIGNIGTTHVKNIAGGKVPNVILSALCDKDSEKLKKAQEICTGVPCFETTEAFFNAGLMDAVLIAVPHYMHPPLAIEAFSRGLHVLCEKPAGVYTKQVIDMNEAAEKSGRMFGIMYNQRTNPLYAKLRELIQKDELGHIKRIHWTVTHWYRPQAYHSSATWRSTWKGEGGGTLINQNPHQIDLWQWMFGMPDRLVADCSFGKYYDIEVEDEVTAYMKYDSGTTGVYVTSIGEAPGTNRLEVACDMGKIVVEDDIMTFWRTVQSERAFNRENTRPFGKPETWKCEIPLSAGAGGQHASIIENFADAILKGTPLLAPGKEGIRGLTISNAMHYSGWTGKTVDLKNFPHDEFYDLLQEKIKSSKMKKQSIQILADTEGTY